MALFISGFPAVASAEIQTVAEAINKAGRQRMLTQRMVRAYSQIGLKVKKPASEKKDIFGNPSSNSNIFKNS